VRLSFHRLLKARLNRRVVIFLCALALLSALWILLQITPSNAQKAPEPTALTKEALKLSPKQPVNVSLGLHISNLADINQTSESFDIAGYLLYQWKDSRLAYDPKGTPKANSLSDIWHPEIEMVNFKSSAASDTSIDIAPDGTVSAQERFSKTLSSGLELGKFPFDRQKLLVVLESLKYPESAVHLKADPSKISIGTDSFVALSEWTVKGISGVNGKSYFPPEQQNYSRVSMEVTIVRNSGFYVLKVMMPLLLITLASWSIFWIKPQEFSTQIGIAFTNLLTIVALLLVINDTLPHVSYLTFMDGFTMICFTTILIGILELLIAHRWEARDDHRRAEKIHHISRWLIPSIFTLSNLILFGVMIGFSR
jgi:Neurotransmitter-gated ion-channel ligand binding domain